MRRVPTDRALERYLRQLRGDTSGRLVMEPHESASATARRLRIVGRRLGLEVETRREGKTVYFWLMGSEMGSAYLEWAMPASFPDHTIGY